MTVTTLDPKTALVVIDLQKGVVVLPTVHPVIQVVRNTSILAAAFRRHGLPVVLVNVAGAAPGRVNQARNQNSLPADYAELVPELHQQPQDHLVTKRTWGAFTNTDLHAYLQQQAVTQLVFAGVATSIGVESTARFAHEYGYNVTLVIDAMTDMNLDAHYHSVTRIFPRIGECGGTQEIIELLDRTRA
jgi:nicotinamidase-related amidase